MLRRLTILAGVLLGLAVASAALMPASHGRAETLEGGQAYYLVVQHVQGGAGASQTTMVSRGPGSMSVTQVGSGTSDVGCTRYSSSADAEAVAADRYAGKTVQVVLAIDALHALAQTANVSNDLLALLPQLADTDVCTP
jgi:hypothetical protein